MFGKQRYYSWQYSKFFMMWKIVPFISLNLETLKSVCLEMRSVSYEKFSKVINFENTPINTVFVVSFVVFINMSCNVSRKHTEHYCNIVQSTRHELYCKSVFFNMINQTCANYKKFKTLLGQL